MEDPVYTDWKLKHPRFPGVARCVELLGSRNTTGSLLEIVCRELERNAATHPVELIAAFRAECDERVREILLSIFCEARLPAAFPVFVENLKSDNERMRYWSIEGLRALDTRESRQVLWNEGVTSHTHRRHAGPHK